MQAFVESPGDAADAMDPVTPYAMDWAVQPVVKGAPKTLCTAKDVYWRRSFEHSKLELDDTSLDDASFMYAYYVPRLNVAHLCAALSNCRGILSSMRIRVISSMPLHGPR